MYGFLYTMAFIIQHKFYYKRMEMVAMTQNELELIGIIKESDDPQAVAAYFFNLFVDYLQKHGPSPESAVAAPLESA